VKNVNVGLGARVQSPGKEIEKTRRHFLTRKGCKVAGLLFFKDVPIDCIAELRVQIKKQRGKKEEKKSPIPAIKGGKRKTKEPEKEPSTSHLRGELLKKQETEGPKITRFFWVGRENEKMMGAG